MAGAFGRWRRLFPACCPTGKRYRGDRIAPAAGPLAGGHRPHRALGGPHRSPGTSGSPFDPSTPASPTPLRGDETGKVGGTSRPRPRSSTFAPSCRRPPSSFPVARRSGQSSGCHRAQSSSLQETHHALGPRSWSGVARVPMRGNESKGRTSADQCRSIGESIVMHGGESLLRQA